MKVYFELSLSHDLESQTFDFWLTIVFIFFLSFLTFSFPILSVTYRRMHRRHCQNVKSLDPVIFAETARGVKRKQEGWYLNVITHHSQGFRCQSAQKKHMQIFKAKH